ncbi:MAG: PD-(D/E)XK nuclease family protein [Lentisphaeria bacterium]|nr:MAG: PD-(D/E)XK nuclease family protein [Lentisphaeria bacterium]
MMATIDELRQEPHWSYSALNTYLNVCQLQYFYRYVEQPEIERTSVCLPFGKAFHAALTAQAWECLMGEFADPGGDRQPLRGVVQDRN